MPTSSADRDLRARRGTLVRVVPRTGRTHQIRAHLEAAGHPIVGDKLYGVPPSVYERYLADGMTPELLEKLRMPRHALHCARLGVEHPCRRERMAFEASFPQDMEAFLRRASGEA